jgi:MFS family permease
MTDASGRVHAEPAPGARLVGARAATVWVAAGAAAAFGAGSVLLFPNPSDTPLYVLPLICAMVAFYAAVGGLISTRQPHNPVGWLLLGAALVQGASIFASGYAGTSITDHGGTWPGTVALAWVAAFTFVPTLGMVLVLVPLVFPGGALLSPAWRWVVVLTILASVLTFVRYAFLPGALESMPSVENPVGINALIGIDPALRAGEPLMLFVCFPLALLSIVLRFRRGSPAERAQLKWFASAAVFAVVFLAVSFAAPSPIADVAWLLGVIGIGLVPASIAVALLRYRLYDIDRIISRTIAWSLVSGILVGGLALGIVALQAALAGVTQGETLAVAATTLVAFGAAQPLLRRVQTAVDHRFNRDHYDAQRTVDAFGERLRDEVALDALARQLETTIDLAVHPSVQGLWLRMAPR